MVSNLYLLLGLPENASFAEMKKQYLRLASVLEAEENANPDARIVIRVCKAREKLSVAYEQAKTIEVQKAYNGEYRSKGSSWQNKINPDSRPKLGQLLVASGIISIEQLDQALEIQQASKVHMPLGRILVSWRYLTEAQLSHFLQLQEVIKLEPGDAQRISMQLLELGLASEDQLAIAKLDLQKHSFTLLDALVRRKWLTVEIANQLAFKTNLPSLPAEEDGSVRVSMTA